MLASEMGAVAVPFIKGVLDVSAMGIPQALQFHVLCTFGCICHEWMFSSILIRDFYILLRI